MMEPSLPGAGSGTEGMTILVFSGDLDKVLAAFIVANGAAAMDIPVTMFFTFWGLNSLRREKTKVSQGKTLMEKMFGRMMPQGPGKLKLSKMNMGGIGTKLLKREMDKKNVYNLPRLIDESRRQGVRMIACSMSMDVMGIRKEELIDGVTFGGVGTFVNSADGGRSTLVF